MMIKEIRKANLKKLAKQTGGTCRLAAQLCKKPSQISRIIGASGNRNISDKFAAYIEKVFKKPAGWLDQSHASGVIFESLTNEESPQALKAAVPLIKWSDIKSLSFKDKKKSYQTSLPTIPLLTSFSKYAFALQIKDDSMQTAPGITFPRGSHIVVEPDGLFKNDSFIIVGIEEYQEPILRQFIYETNSAKYLKPLNPIYPVIEYQNCYIIYGVVHLIVCIIK